VQAIAADDPTRVIDQARHLMDRGREPLTVLQNLASFYRDLLIAKATPDRLDLVAMTPPTWAELCQFAQGLDIATILRGQQRLRESELQVRNSTQPRLWLEVTLMGLLPGILAASVGQASGRQLEGQLPPVQRTTEPIAKSPQDSVPANASPTPLLAKAEPEVAHQNGLEKNGKERNGQANEQKSAVSPPTPPVLPSVETGDARPTRPEPVAEPTPAVSGFDLVQVWNELIANLQPPGTQMLLRQQGRLIAFDGQEAKVGFSSQPLFKMAIERAPNIEAAFAKIYGHKIRVSLEVVAPRAEAPATAAPLAPPEPRSPRPIVRETAAEFNVPPSAPPAPETGRSASVQPSPPAVQTVPQPAAESAAWQAEDEVSRAAKSLAQMFNGQIVSSDSQVLPGLAAAELPLTQEAELINEPDAETDDDEDVPF
jgi:DNA polymerase-3 subunit gamma/tau